jgi:PAS domain S-box-containing protein
MVVDKLDAARAIENGEFVPHFQPLVDLRTRELQGFELLARWNHPLRGWVSPDEFIPLAERDGWIHLLSAELLEKGFRAVASLPGAPTLSFNISALQLRDVNLSEQIRVSAEKAGLSLDRLIVEITESALTQDLDSARMIVDALKEMGCRLALDDFGTGYSSLLHLQSLPFDELKVDRSFVGSMTKQRDSRKIVAAVVGLGQSLGLTTVAEGIETEEQAEMLLWLGCELGQGWLYGKPVPAAQLAGVISDHEQKQAFRPLSDAVIRASRNSVDSLPSQRLAQLQAVYDGAPVGLAFLDRNLRYLSINRRLANMNGIPIEQHLGRTVAEIVPDMFSRVEPFIRRALAGEAITGVEVTKPASGSSPEKNILLSYEPARDEAGEVVGVSVALADMTPIRRAEDARRESQEHLRYMMELIPQIPWVLDREGRALDVSQRWLEISGMTGEQWRGFGWLEALHPDDRQPTRDAMQSSLTNGLPIDVQYRVRQSEAHPWKWIRSRGSARRDENGVIIGWYGSLEVFDERQ